MEKLREKLKGESKYEFFNLEDLSNIMKYKLKRGSFRPSLQKLIESNDKEECE
jgi:hypothetical protein